MPNHVTQTRWQITPNQAKQKLQHEDNFDKDEKHNFTPADWFAICVKTTFWVPYSAYVEHTAEEPSGRSGKERRFRTASQQRKSRTHLDRLQQQRAPSNGSGRQGRSQTKIT